MSKPQVTDSMKKLGFLIGLLAITVIAILWSIIGTGCSSVETEFNAGLQISTEHPRYWSYNGKEVLLLGGSVEDNLFQIPNLSENLDLLIGVGGNYVRNKMSSRDEGNEWPFKMDSDSLYDLNEWNEEYWKRFREFLEETHQRKIFIQLEVWATFDFYRENWLRNPFNPKNNKNYSARRVKLDLEVDTHPIYTENNFFTGIHSDFMFGKFDIFCDPYRHSPFF